MDELKRKECKMCHEFIDDAETYCQDCIDIIQSEIDPRLKEAIDVINEIRNEITATSENEEGYLNGIGMCLCELFDRIPELKDSK